MLAFPGQTAKDVLESGSVPTGKERPRVGDAVQGSHDSIGHAQEGNHFRSYSAIL